MKRVLVFNANERSALAVTRSLGHHGVPVFTADETPSSLAGRSHYSKSYFKYPSPRTRPLEFIEYIAELILDQHIDMIMPMTELTSTLLMEHCTDLPNVALPFADLDTVQALSDKCQLMRIAANLDVPTPFTWYVSDTSTIPDILPDLTYPVVLKPGRSWQLSNREWYRHAVRFAANPEEAVAILKSDLAFQHPYMLQACVPGEGRGIFAIYDHGQPIAFFAHRRLREKPPSGGVSVFSESIAPDPVMLAYARRLLDEVKWHGVAMVEFKHDQQCGISYLMEVNTRFWGSLQLAIDAEVDFPWLLYQITCEAQVNIVNDYQLGGRLRWLLGDLDNLYLNMRRKDIGAMKKLAVIMAFLTPDPFRTRHEINRWDDMGPFWAELWQYVQNLRG